MIVFDKDRMYSNYPAGFEMNEVQRAALYSAVLDTTLALMADDEPDRARDWHRLSTEIMRYKFASPLNVLMLLRRDVDYISTPMAKELIVLLQNKLPRLK